MPTMLTSSMMELHTDARFRVELLSDGSVDFASSIGAGRSITWGVTPKRGVARS